MLSLDRVNDELRALHGYRGMIIVDIIKERERYGKWATLDTYINMSHEDWVVLLETYLRRYHGAKRDPAENKRALLVSLAAQTVAALEALDAAKRRSVALSPYPIVDKHAAELLYG